MATDRSVAGNGRQTRPHRRETIGVSSESLRSSPAANLAARRRSHGPVAPKVAIAARKKASQPITPELPQ
jgi:hypothetical protein